jgi:hypothetical protein
MICRTACTGDKLTLTLRGERQRSTVWRVFLFCGLTVSFHYAIHAELWRVLAETTGASVPLFLVTREQFGVSELIVDPSSIQLTRKTFGIGRTRTFPRPNTERLGYEPANRDDDAALAIMIRTVMMPIRFAHGITPTEARQLFQSIRENHVWLADHIVEVGTPLF